MVVYLNGEFLPESEACISVLDRGFLFGDGVYEVVPVYSGILFRLEQHLARLQRSLHAIRIPDPFGLSQWHELLEALVARNGGGELSVYVQVTRGISIRDHAIPSEVRPTVFAMANPAQPTPAEVLSKGVRAITLTDNRWARCDIKAITLLPNVLLRQQAIDAGATEAILVRDGFATEGAASNLFIVRDNVISTPPKGHTLLPGITRELVVELARTHDLLCREEDIGVTMLRGADEIWLSSSTREVIPVTELDGERVGDGVPGRMWSQIYQLYQGYKRQQVGRSQ